MTAGERGLRVAVIGKGGTGKTVVAAGLARILAGRGRRVLAADLDSSPGLAMSLGMAPTDAGLPLAALEQSAEGTYGWRLAPAVSAEEAVEKYASMAPGGVRYLGFGRISALDRESTRQSVHAVVSVLKGLAEPGWDVIADLDAGPTGPFQRFHDFADQVVMVVGPTWTSQFATRSLSTLIEPHQSVVVVCNRAAPGAATLFSLPEDPDLNRAERHGLCPFDAVPPTPAVAALDRLADLLMAGPRPSGDAATAGSAARAAPRRAAAMTTAGATVAALDA